MKENDEEPQGRKPDPEKLGKEVSEWYRYFRDRLQSRHTAARDMWKLYLNQLKDNRKEYEKWRSMIHSPHHTSAVDVVITNSINMLYPGGRSPIMPEAVPGAGEEKQASRLTKWFDWVIRMNRSKRETELELREIIVQSMCIRKNIFVEKTRMVTRVPSDTELAEFDIAIEKAIDTLGQPPPKTEDFESREDFDKSFLEFRKLARAAGVDLPEIPKTGPYKTVHYKGPTKKRVSYFNFFFDLGVPLQEQTKVIERHYVTKKWIMDRTGPGDDKPFDPELVEEALKPVNDRAGQEELDLQSIFGANDHQISSPKFQEMVMALEMYDIESPHPYRFALSAEDSGSALCINKVFDNPFEHGDHPYTLMGGIELPFVSSSMSELYQIDPLIKAGNTIRGLRYDGVKMAVTPVFSRLKTSSLGEQANRVSPGIIHDSPAGSKGMSQVSNVVVPDVTFRENEEIRNEIDEYMGTGGTIRGQVAPPRTTAQGIERAHGAGQIRSTSRIIRWEEDNQRTVEQWLWLAKQYYDDDFLTEMGGVVGANILMEFDRKDFIDGITKKYAFRAASSAINKDIQNQQLQSAFTLGVNAQVPRFKPDALFERIIRNIDEDAAADCFYSAEEWSQLQAQQQQAAAEQQPPQGPPQPVAPQQGQPPQQGGQPPQ